MLPITSGTFRPYLSEIGPTNKVNNNAPKFTIDINDKTSAILHFQKLASCTLYWARIDILIPCMIKVPRYKVAAVDLYLFFTINSTLSLVTFITMSQFYHNIKTLSHIPTKSSTYVQVVHSPKSMRPFNSLINFILY